MLIEAWYVAPVGLLGLDSAILTPMAAVSLVVLGGLAAVVCRWLVASDRTQHSFWALLPSAVSLAVILSVTLLRDPWSPALSMGPWSSDGWELVSTDPLRSPQVMLNGLLFVPAGLLLSLVTRRPVRVLVALTLLSGTIEVLQGVTRSGAKDLGDLVANAAGAALGAGGGWLVLRLREDLRQRRPPHRTLGLAVAGATAVGVVLVGFAQAGAQLQLRALTRELEATYRGTTLADVRQWEQEDLLSEMVFDAVSVRSDGIEDGEWYAEFKDHPYVRVRYPATFFSARRCAFVEWSNDDMRVLESRGRDCTRLYGYEPEREPLRYVDDPLPVPAPDR